MTIQNGLLPAEDPPAFRRVTLVIGALTILALGALSILPIVTRQPPAETTPAEFSVERALEHIGNIAIEPHPMGSAANARVRSYLERELTALGLEPQLQSMTVPDYYGAPGATVEAVNVMARLDGLDSTRAIALVAHYDSDPTTFGANDNAVAVAAILDAARALLAGPAIRNDVILLLTDGEEPAPRYGSTAFVAQHPWADDVGFIVNFEAAGGSGQSMVVELNGPEEWLVEGLAESAAHPVAFSFLTDTVKLFGGIGTDFDPFAARNVPGFHLAYLRGTPIYHTLNDSTDNVGLGSLQQHGSYAVSLTRQFGDMDLTEPPRSGELVFFTVMRSWIVRYPVGWAVPLASMAAVLFTVAMARRVRRRELHFWLLLLGSGVVLVGVVVAMLASTVVWIFFSKARQTPAVGESYAYLFALLALSAGLGALIWRGAKRRWGNLDASASVVLVWVALAVVTSVLLPGASYLFVWPALGGAIALIWSAGAHPEPASRFVPLLLVAAPSLILIVPAVDTFFLMALPRPGNPDSDLVETIAVVIFLAVLVVALIASIAGQPGWRARPRVVPAELRTSHDQQQQTHQATPTSFTG
jgi:hypothetical protein